MALFDDDVTISPAPKRKRSRRATLGMWSLVTALVLLLGISFLPTSYVIQRPGPVYDTLGTAANSDGEEVPLISVEGADVYPTAGALDLLTVQVQGTRARTPSWFELMTAWFDPSKAVVPIESVFPEGQTSEERSAANTALMVNSQEEATAAALLELGYDIGAETTIFAVDEGSAADGVLRVGDVIVTANALPVADAVGLRAIIADGEGSPLSLEVERDGAMQDIVVTPLPVEAADTSETWLLGVTLTTSFDFPVDVTIQLDNVGGPSAGMMFALGIIDTMTAEELNGGENFAGTGTISANGVVGPIGGIRQKLWGAVNADADYFLAPSSNCNEVVGHVPDGLQVFAVDTLDDALTALAAVSEGGDLEALASCEG